MTSPWGAFLLLMKSFLARRFLVAGSTCLALGLITARPLRAQTTYPITGTAGFETGIQKIATVDSIIVPGLDWGDGTSTVCPAIGEEPDACALAFGGPIGTDVYGTHRYALPGTYTITVSYVPFPFISKTATTTATITPPGDFVILSIGDSIASGEGNPVIPADNNNHPNWGWWDDPYSDYVVSPFPADEAAEWPNQTFPCHRSRLAGPAQAGQEIQRTNPGVTFIHYACSGAKVNAADTAKNTVQDAAGQLIVARKRLPRIDLLIISAGANDFNDGSDCVHKNQFGCGFGALFQYCLNPFNTCSNNPGLNLDIANSLNVLHSEYQNLAMQINCVQPFFDTQIPGCTDPQKQIPKLVLITEYMDPTHDQNGNFSTSNGCPA